MTDDEQALVKEVWELTPFETEYVPTEVKPIRWSNEKFKAAQMLALSGKNKKQTAKALNLPVNIIEKWAESSEFQEYMQTLVEDYNKQMKNSRLMMLNKMLMARVEQAEMTGYADLSRKDTLDIIAEIRKESGEDKAADVGYTRILENLVKHSIENQPKTIPVQGE